MDATASVQDYLGAIYDLAGSGKPVIGARLAKYMKLSAPAVTEAVQRMVQAGYVRVGRNKELALTRKGRAQAEIMARRHRLLERWLTDVLGLDWMDAHEEAHRLEHALSPKVEDRLAGAERQPGDKDLLAQAAQVLRGLEADPGKGEGMRDSGPGQEGKGTGSGEEHQDEGRTEASAIGDKKKREENSPGGEKVSDRGPGTGDRAGDRKLQQNREEKKENERMAQTGSEGRGRKEMRDEIRGPLPERFLKPGEAEKVLKGARFVTVELPEEEIAGEGGESVPGKRGRSRVRLPVSNLPLRPPDSPDAPPEKQPLPLEYRGLIR